MNTVHSGSLNDHHLDPERSLALRRAAKASFIGNFIEWFDYASYGYLATVIGLVFFPEADKSVRLMSTFAVFAMSFILRPIGAIIWGAWGDRWGRRWALSWSILIMSGSTFLIGLLPTYSVIGVAAAVGLLLLRMIQGFSASGEYAGAGTFLAEYAPPSRRGIYTSLVPASTACGLLAGSLMVTGMFTVLSDSAVNTWGWRVPFLLAGPLGLIGRYIRVHLEDSPVYQEMLAEIPQEEKSAGWSEPLRLLFRDHLHDTLITFGVSCLNAVAFYMLLSYMPTYVHEELGFSQDTATLATSVMLLVYIASIFFMGHMSDSFGRRRMLIAACIAFIVLTIPLFIVMTKATGMLAVVILCQIAFAIILTANDGTLATFLAESFPTNVRYSGFALSFNGANALLGGTTPFIVTWLIKVTGSPLAPAVYLTVIALIAMVAIFQSRTIHGSDLTEE
ncbi:MFS transporter [Actinomyces naeslundii]|uniref:Putative proline/betaine transporter n=2 Tax=Actinomyces TaxID=1654 RepID=A0A1Q8XQZ9_ACTNA|nr:MFS transporter [Actinomyces naeslundii]OLO86582.1 MFS transporter [Actinomyces naeslundii]OMG11242.1 MFS transporter [Actinomyces naeslundii]OMG18111.1 MFS transporter [Actinomyces naeslundii]PKY94318.1 MFS transporter [Actinomyces naeslundii]WAL42200.1 MFS transporter [Actinomyces naeslundii]